MGKNMNSKKPTVTILKTFKCVFVFVVIVNILVLIERGIFDFLGFMFGAITADVLNLIFLIVGLFGAYQYRVNYIVTCILWCLMWIGWNTFVICNYLNIGILNRYDPFVLSFNTDKKSWWLTSSIGCTNVNDIILAQKFYNISENKDTYENLDNFLNKNCILPFYWIEIIHASVFIFLTILVIIFGLLLSNVFNDEDDTFDYIGGFDTSNIVYAYNTDNILQNNGHVRLEPLYATNTIN